MSQINGQYVHKGYWIDRSRGPVMGKTITTDTTTGNVVVAVIAVLTTIGTKRCWNLALFAYHQMRVHRKRTDGLYRQQQALIRTLPGPASMFSDWTKLSWAWRTRVNRSFLRSLPLIILSLIFAALTIVVGIFSSYLVDSTNISILVSSPRCGPMDYLSGYLYDNSTDQEKVWIEDYSNKVTELSSQYVQDCYTNQTATPERCRIYLHPMLPLTTGRTSCPFDTSMCKNISEPGLVTDTGLLSMKDQFGLNLAGKDDIKFRRKAACAVLDLEGHYDTYTTKNISDIDVDFLVGRKIWEEEKVRLIYLGGSPPSNLSTVLNYMPQDDERSVTTGLKMYQGASPWGDNGFSIEPIPQLKTEDSDLVIMFLRLHGITFLEPVDDPLFPAHKVRLQSQIYNETLTYYMSDDPVSVFSCITQYQFCFPQNGQGDECTTLQGLPPLDPDEDFPPMNEAQLALYKLVVSFLFFHNENNVPAQILAPALNPYYNPPLPSDQWIRQIVMMQQYLIAIIQVAMSTHAVGPSTLNLVTEPLLMANASEAEKKLCGLQKMRSPGGFVNINVFALAFVITFCTVMTILDLLLLRFIVFWRGFRGFFAPRIDAWIQDGVFQLQRRAYEAQGEGVWERLDKEIPATTDGAELSTFPLVSRPPCNCAPFSPVTARTFSTMAMTLTDTREDTKKDGAETVLTEVQAGESASESSTPIETVPPQGVAELSREVQDGSSPVSRHFE